MPVFSRGPLVPLLLGLVSVGACACTTPVDIQVPGSKVNQFAACMQNPGDTYVRGTPANGVTAFGRTVLDARLLALGRDQLIVTNDLLAGASLAPTSSDWADGAAPRFGATPDELRAAAQEADELWNHPVHQTFLKIHNELTTLSDDSLDLPTISVRDVRDYLTHVRTVTEKDGWNALAIRSFRELSALTDADKANAQPTRNADRNVRALQIKRTAQQLIGAGYVSTYLRAYFRNGRFVALKYDINPVELLQSIRNSADPVDQQTIDRILAAIGNVDPDAAAKLAEIIRKGITGTIGKVADVGLVTRGGDSLAMPAISISIAVPNPEPITFTKVDINAVIEDVVRVTFEALFDAYNQIPAVSKATGVQTGENGIPVEYASFALPDFAKVTAPMNGPPKMSSDSFGKVDANGAKVHALVASSVAGWIRGINVASLNNESVANAVTTVAATTARKVTERASWCYYAVTASAPNQERNSVPLSDKTVRLYIRYGLF